jgi:hypothetical protein
MVSTRKQEQAVAAASNPLKDAGILRHVFSFLPGNYLFLGGVCPDWRTAYAGIEDHRLRRAILDNDSDSVFVTCGNRTTL